MLQPLTALLSRPGVTQASSFLNEGTYRALGIEVLGINLPKTLIVRTKDEMIDSGVNEFSNTLGFFGGLAVLRKVVDGVLSKCKMPASVGSVAQFAKSVALMPPLIAFMFAVPRFRNAFTIWRTGKTDFKQVISNNGRADDPEKVREASNKEFKKGMGAVVAGFALGALGLAASLTVGKPVISKWMQGSAKKLIEPFLLVGKKAGQLTDFQSLLYWGLPCYLGLMAASRDIYEKKEQFLKMINFMVMFAVPPFIVEWMTKAKTQEYAKAFPKLFQNEKYYFWNRSKFSYGAWKEIQAQQAKLGTKFLSKEVFASYKANIDKVRTFSNGKVLGNLALSVLLMATFPLLLNIVLTKKRIARDEKKKAVHNAQHVKKQPTPPPQKLERKQSIPLSRADTSSAQPSEMEWRKPLTMSPAFPTAYAAPYSSYYAAPYGYTGYTSPYQNPVYGYASPWVNTVYTNPYGFGHPQPFWVR